MAVTIFLARSATSFSDHPNLIRQDIFLDIHLSDSENQFCRNRVVTQ